MAGDTTITVIGNLVEAPELRFTPGGHAVAKFRVASTPRFMDRQTQQWKDGDPLFLYCEIWRHPAENAAESLKRGDRVVLSGQLKQRTYETNEGQKRTVMYLTVDEIGPSLRYATAKVQKMSRTNGSSQGGQHNNPSDDDPWASAQPAGARPSGGSSYDDEPPF
jgi:single-strand DNA-binding protein